MTIVVTAVVTGVGVLLAGNLTWGALAPLNVRVAPGVPWAVVPMAGYLWVYWRVIGGRFLSPGTAAARRERLRANPVRAEAWPLAIVTGLVGFGALLALLAAMARLMAMPASSPIEQPSAMPHTTMVVLLIMSSAVAGITEEAGFRGYMQGPIERRYGLLAGILVNGTMFGLLHYPNHPQAVLSMLPYYIAVAAVYGSITWATNSIHPAVVLHVGGDVWSLTRMWATGQAEWQLSTVARPTVWVAGPDTAFISTVVVLLALGVMTVMMCRMLRRVAAPVNGVPL